MQTMCVDVLKYFLVCAYVCCFSVCASSLILVCHVSVSGRDSRIVGEFPDSPPGQISGCLELGGAGVGSVHDVGWTV